MADSRRKLAAILSADAAGYSRLMGADEDATIAAIDASRQIFRDRISVRAGRVVDTAGDSVLAAFESVLEAVRCATEVQQALAETNAGLPEDRRMRFRIGVNLGDVVEKDDGSVYGDGVNIAARLESLAEPGGICISEDVYRQVAGKIDLVFDDIGEHEVKNIVRPLRAYRVVAGTRTQTTAESPLALPDKPSIAVLPFENMSGDPEHEYFADGIAEDLITALSRIRWLFVIARNSTFTYKGAHVKVQQVAAELGVRYVLEGSVRRGGDRIRISAQLIEATTGNHIWAQRYDRELDDFFDLQDEITETISAAIEPEIGQVERERARHKPPSNLDAWECYQRGLWHVYRYDREDNTKAQELLRRAIELDPNFTVAYAALGYSHFADITLAFTDSRPESVTLSFRAAQKAVDLDDKDAMAHHALGRAYYVMGDGKSSIAELSMAIELNPSFALAHYGLGMTLFNLAERPGDALEEFQMAIRLSPHDPAMFWFEHESSMALLMLGREQEALDYAQKASRHPNLHFWVHVNLAAILGRLGDIEKSRDALGKVFELRPDFSADLIESSWEGGYASRELKDKVLIGLGKAGLDIPNESQARQRQ